MVLIEGEQPGRKRRATTMLAERIEHATELDDVAKSVNQVAQRVAGTGARHDALSGTWIGHPLHPALVAAPIGLWGAASIMDLMGDKRAARRLVGAGILAAVPTALSGTSDWADTMGAERRVGFVHMAANVAATTTYLMSWRARRKGHHARGALLGGVGAGLLAAGGWLGGHLSYKLGVGVDTNAFDTGPQEWTPLEGDIPESGPAAGEIVMGSAGGTRVVVVGTARGPRALADRCTHRGGPLSEGTTDGSCVTCPWHASRFDLDTGEVVQGPASVPQPVYEIRRSEGRWEVRRHEESSLRKNTVSPG